MPNGTLTMLKFLASFSDELSVLAVVFLTAALVHVLAPFKRHKIRRLLLVAVGQLASAALAIGFHRLGLPAWELRANLACDLLAAVLFVQAAGVALFDVLLPRIGVSVLSITSDLAVGFTYIVSTIAVLRGAGLNPTEVVATGAVVSAVVALSLQSTLGNILGGVALQIDGSIHVGDWVQLENGRQGKVTKIRWRHTVLETRNFSTIIVPNATLLSTNITILGRRDGKPVPARYWVYFNVDHRFSPARVCDVVSEALSAAPIERVALDPKPSVICVDLAQEQRPSFALYAVRYWLTDLAVDDPTSSLVRARIHAALGRAGIPLAVPATKMFVEDHDEQRARRKQEEERARRVAVLRSLPFFQVLDETELTSLADRLRFAPFVRGETMTRQGAVAHWLYLMEHGKAEIRTKQPDNAGIAVSDRVVSTLVGPAVFGEMGLMTGEPRTASVVAVTDTTCYRLDKESFADIVAKRPAIAEELSHVLARRRVELLATRESMGAAQRSAKEASERERILGAIQNFFGL